MPLDLIVPEPETLTFELSPMDTAPTPKPPLLIAALLVTFTLIVGTVEARQPVRHQRQCRARPDYRH